jgi:tRNA-Thr(GGU) m(6)t(6)A37 methyltransferase TsaA
VTSPPHLIVEPIGIIRTPFTRKADTPRQPRAAAGTPGVIELYPGRGFEDALDDLASWKRIWVLFWFDRATTWKPHVLPPRSKRKRGVFSTRAPHRPNPIGLSVLALDRVEGLRVHVRDVDILDETPVIDIKPYVAYTDAIADASGGWLEAPNDPVPSYEVVHSPRAEEALAFLDSLGVDLRPRLENALALGPAPHAYRRIRRDGEAYRISVSEWVAKFVIEDKKVIVLQIGSGIRPRDLVEKTDPALDAHRVFAARFGHLMHLARP